MGKSRDGVTCLGKAKGISRGKKEGQKERLGK